MPFSGVILYDGFVSIVDFLLSVWHFYGGKLISLLKINKVIQFNS